MALEGRGGIVEGRDINITDEESCSSLGGSEADTAPLTPQGEEELGPLATEEVEKAMEEKREWRMGLVKTVLEQHEPSNTSPLDEELRNALFSMAESGEGASQTEVDRLYHILVKGGNKETAEAPKKMRRKRHGKGKRAYRRYMYARTQDLKNNPSNFARLVKEGKTIAEQEEGTLNTSEVEKSYKELWGTAFFPIPETYEAHEQIPLSNVLTAYTAGEIKAKMASTKARTAPGPDGLRKQDVVAINKSTLALYYNVLLCAEKQPSAWLENRTKLLLKEGKDSSKVENHRPLTISSIEKAKKHNRVQPEAKGIRS